MSAKKPKRHTQKSIAVNAAASAALQMLSAEMEPGLRETTEKENLMSAKGLREFVALIRSMDGESVEHFLKVYEAIQSGKIHHDKENSCLILRDKETMQEIFGDDHQDTWSLD